MVVPNFGAFLTQKIAARINDKTNTFSAPSKSVGFNEQLISNDGLLVSHIAAAEQATFETILQKLEEVTTVWKTTLEKGEKLHLHTIGSLWNNEEGKIQFQPYLEVNYLTSSFGLNTITSIPVTREVLKEEVLSLEEKIPFTISPEKRRTAFIRPYLKYAALLLLSVSTGLTGYHFYKNTAVGTQIVQQEAQKQITKQIQEATFFNTTPLELPTIALRAEKKYEAVVVAPKHHIVAGAFRSKANADRKIQSLIEKGYEAAYYGTNKFGLHMVTYDRFANPKDAIAALKVIKKEELVDAWLLSEK